MKTKLSIALCSFSLGVAALNVPPAYARPGNPNGGPIPSNPKDWNKGGVVREVSTNGAFTDFTLWPTDPQGNEITGNDRNGNAWPQTKKNVPRDGHHDFVVPPGQIGGKDTADWKQSSRTHSRADNSALQSFGTNWLWIESVFFDASTNSYYMDGVFDLLDTVYGPGVFLNIPDLFADTDNSGGLDENDVLYSLVDLRQFCVNAPSFADNETFSIVNGQVSGLPGMKFSTTPFSFSSSSGWDSGTPYTGDGTTYAYHSLSPSEVPEPGVTMLVGVAALTALRRRRDARQSSVGVR